MVVEIKVPEVGESITEGVIVEWFKSSGAQIEKDEPLFELETDKITMQVQSEVSGRLTIAVDGGDVTVGQVVGSVDTAAAGETVAEVKQAPSAVAPPASAPSPVLRPSEKTDKPLSPAVRRVVDEHGLDPNNIEGTGRAGRLTKVDVTRAAVEQSPAASGSSGRDQGKPASQLPASAPKVQPTPPADPPLATTRPGVGRAQQLPPPPITHGAPPSVLMQQPGMMAASPPSAEGAVAGPRETRSKMTSLRRRIAQRLLDVQQSAAILTTFNEVDMGAAMALRSRYKDQFLERHGVKLGFMSFFVKAVVEALRSVPAVNARIEGEEIVQNHYYDVGVAVGTDRGLVVPVIRGADTLSFAGVERQIAEFAQRARDRRLDLADLQGGCFTISNGGVYGSLLSTPIINPPQSAILGMHAIKKRPMVVGSDDRIEARPMMYLAMSYDHRLVDGLEAVTFLKRIVECIETPDRLLFEV